MAAAAGCGGRKSSGSRWRLGDLCGYTVRYRGCWARAESKHVLAGLLYGEQSRVSFYSHVAVAEAMAIENMKVVVKVITTDLEL